jgi:hypothetical protein
MWSHPTDIIIIIKLISFILDRPHAVCHTKSYNIFLLKLTPYMNVTVIISAHSNVTGKLGRGIAQEVSCWPLIAETWFAPWSVHAGFMVNEVTLGQVFL